MKAEEELRPGFLRNTFEAEDAEPPIGGLDRLMEDLGRQNRRPRPFLWLLAPALLLLGVGAWFGMNGLNPVSREAAPIASSRPAGPTKSESIEPATSTPATSAAPEAAQSPTTAPDQDASEEAAKAPAHAAETATQPEAAPVKAERAAKAAKASRRAVGTVAVTASKPRPVVARNASEGRSKEGSQVEDKSNLPKTEPATTNQQPTTAATPARKYRKVRSGAGLVATVGIGSRADRAAARMNRTEGSSGGSQSVARQDAPAQPVAAKGSDENLTETSAASTQNNQAAASPILAPEMAATGDSVKMEQPAANAVVATDSTPKTVIPTKEPKLAHRWEKAVYATTLVRRRDAVLIRSEEGERINWSASQRGQIPGLELGGGLGYRLGKNLTLGASLGLGMWQERFDMSSQFEKPEPTISFNRMTAAYDVSPEYQEKKTGYISWMAWQAHSVLWLRLGDPALPITAQAGASLDAVSAFNEKSSGPSTLAPNMLPGSKVNYVPGVEARFRFKPRPGSYRGMVYEISGRNHFKPAFNNAGLFKLQYGMVTFGASFVW